MMRSGFTLIEMIITVVVLSVAVPTTLELFHEATVRRQESVQSTLATHFSEAILETIVTDVSNPNAGLGLNALIAPGYAATIERRLGPAGTFYRDRGFSYTVNISQPVADDGRRSRSSRDVYRYVTANVSWTPAGAGRPITMSTSVLVADVAAATSRRGNRINAAPDPGGFTTSVTLDGGLGTPRQPSQWAHAMGGRVYWAWRSRRPITYTTQLTPRPGQQWKIGVTALNWGRLGLPPNYSEFQVQVYVDGDCVGRLDIPASEAEWQTAWIPVGELTQNPEIRLDWRNDRYRRGQYDANIAIGAVQFAHEP